MATKISLKKSSVEGKVPLATDLEMGELAVNLADKKLYSKNTTNQIINLSGAHNWEELLNKPTVVKELVTLLSGQKIVNFNILVESSEFYINGTDTDNGQLFLNSDYTVDVSNNRIILIDSYPANTKILGIQNKVVQLSDAGSISEFEQALNY